MLKLSLCELDRFFAAVAEKETLYLPVDKDAGQAQYKKWEAGVKLSDALNTTRSAKDFFFPQTENLADFRVSGKTVEIIDDRKECEDFVVFGVRACDARSFDVLDRVFLADPVDTYYKNRRDHGTVITLACDRPAETCFCRTFGIDAANPGGDVSAWKVDDSAAHAKALYKCAVSDVRDTASVVDLLEAMELEKVSGEYKAEISSKDGKEVLALTLSEKISGKDKKVFDNNMKLCAQQMLALIPGVQVVEWTYSIESDSAEAEQATVSLDVDGAKEGLSHDIRSYGKSAKAVQKLLTEQAGS